MISVLIDDLAQVAADAVVRPATTDLAPATAVAERLDAVGGTVGKAPETVRDRLDAGAAVVTAGGALPAEFIIHAVVGEEATDITAAALRRALQSALERAVQFDVEHLAIPPVGAGPGGLDLGVVAQCTVEVIREHLLVASFPVRVSIVVQSTEEETVFDQALRAFGAVG